MDKDLQKLVLYAMQVHYANGLSIMNEVIKDYFDAIGVDFILTDDPIKNTDKNSIVIPINIDEVCYGYYKIYNPKKDRKQDIAFITAILTSMHTNVIDYSNKTQESYHDASTGLYNKNFYYSYCNSITPELINSISCVFVDINGLHEINNNEGHLKGDKVINFVANVLLEKYGKEDMVFRVGGDEFVIMITDKEQDYAPSKFEEIKTQLKKHEIYVSIGYDYQKSPKIDINSLIKNADENMYIDKENFYARGNNNRRSRR